jgi:hypothetical protein
MTTTLSEVVILSMPRTHCWRVSVLNTGRASGEDPGGLTDGICCNTGARQGDTLTFVPMLAAHQAPPNRTRRWAHAMMESASRVSDPAVTKQALDFAKRTHAGNPNNTLPFVGGTFVTYGLVQWDSSGTDSAAVFT